MARFVQIIEFRTSRIEEIEALGRPSGTEGSTAPTFRRILASADRDRPGTYLTIVEFDSYDSAMENSARPETFVGAPAFMTMPTQMYSLVLNYPTQVAAVFSILLAIPSVALMLAAHKHILGGQLAEGFQIK